jgi:hypothetical protein
MRMMNHGKRGNWVAAALVVVGIAAACSTDDDGEPGEGNAGAGDAGEAGRSMAGGGAGSGLGGADANAGEAMGGTAVGGSPGGAGGDATAGAGGDVTGGTGGIGGSDATAGAGDGGGPPAHSVVCPELGQPFVLNPHEEHTDDELALAKAFGCDLDDFSSRSLVIERVVIAQPSVHVMWSPHTLDDTYDAFRLDSDCAAAGYVSPGAPSSYTRYPGMVAEVLQPGTYTHVSCAMNLQALTEPVPAPPTNVDCAHATPLGELTESRILEPARFYSLSIDDNGEDQDVEVWLSSAQSNASVLGILKGVSNGFSATTHDGQATYLAVDPLSFSNVPAGQYCLELQVARGAQYDIDTVSIY